MTVVTSRGSGMRRLGFAARLLVAAGLLAAPAAAPVRAPAARDGASLELFNGTVSATAAHVQGGSSAFPNFASGAVDNRYPLAHARLESSPFALATASPADTGPLGQTLAAEAQQTQPQYATVRCPPDCGEADTTGAPPGPGGRAEAAGHRAEASAGAAATSLDGGSAAPARPAPAPPDPPQSAPEAPARPAPVPPAGDDPEPAPLPPPPAGGLPPVVPAAFTPGDPPGGIVEPLRSRLAEWRRRFLTAGDAARYPLPTAAPDGLSGLTATGRAESEGGALVLTGESVVGRAVLAGGQVVLQNVMVRVVLTNDGTPERDVTVDIGAAEIAGVPVRIGPDGISVDETRVPGLAGAAGPVDAALNEVLTGAGVEIRTVEPLVRRSEHQEELDAVGVHVQYRQPPPAPGVPGQFVTVALGEVFAGSLAVPGGTVVAGRAAEAAPGPAPSRTIAGAGAPSGPRGPQAGSPSGFYDVYRSIPGPAGSRPPAAGAETGLGPVEPIVRRDRPVEIIVLYGVAQALALASAATLWAWRKEAAV